MSKVSRPTKHIIGHIGDGFFTDQMTKPTVSKHRRKVVRVRLQSHQVHPIVLQKYNTHIMQYDCTTRVGADEKGEEDMPEEFPFKFNLGNMCTVVTWSPAGEDWPSSYCTLSRRRSAAVIIRLQRRHRKHSQRYPTSSHRDKKGFHPTPALPPFLLSPLVVLVYWYFKYV